MRNGHEAEWENLIVNPAQGMMKVFEKGETTVTAKLDYGVYHLTIPLEAQQTAVKSELSQD
jgi:hypothetical protein